jgi:hypothetical protein
LLVLLGLAGFTALPQLQRPVLQPQATAAPQAAPAAAAGEQQVLQQLALADGQWRPRAEPLAGGGTRYRYRRRPGDPELSIAQIKALMANPPRFERERLVISDLWRRLAALGVRLELSQPRKVGAAGEWDPARATLRIKPAVLGKGSAEFARVLNHEAIHVAQSCSGGGIRANPKPLGLPRQLPAHLQSVLQDPTYARADARERLLEREAYANQEQLELGLTLLKLHC